MKLLEEKFNLSRKPQILSTPKKGSCFYNNIIITRTLTKPNKIWHFGKKIYPRDKFIIYTNHLPLDRICFKTSSQGSCIILRSLGREVHYSSRKGNR